MTREVSKSQEPVLDELDNLVLHEAYTHIEESDSKRVSGSWLWERVSAIRDIAPYQIPASLGRLVRLGLLKKDKANSSSRVKVYAGTDAGSQTWRETKVTPQQ